MRTLAILIVLLALVCYVSAQATTTSSSSDPSTWSPAIIAKPRKGLSRPRIHATGAGAAPAPNDQPLTGKAPANLKKAKVRKNIYGGSVEYKVTKGKNGCTCKTAVPDKFNYNIELRDPKKPAAKKSACSCGKKKKAAKKGDGLPPIVAELRAPKTKAAPAAPCAKPAAKPKAKKASVAPEYYPKRSAKRAKKAAKCGKKPAPAKPKTITPAFYP